MTSTPAAETAAARVQRLKAEHRAAVAKLQSDRDLKVREIETGGAAAQAEWDLQQQHRRELEQEGQKTLDAVTLAHRRRGRAYRTHLGLPLTLEQRRDLLHEMVEGERLEANLPGVVQLRTWLEDVCRRERIDDRECVSPAVTRGQASPPQRWMRTPPAQSYQTATTKAHELAHIVDPFRDPAAPTVKITAMHEGKEVVLQVICVQHEISAWRWVLNNVPVWAPAMHQLMTECINTYRPHGTAAEADAIDELCSKLTFRRVQLRLLTA